nr:hypothetical protein [uncultured Rhodopila sp.]
MPEGSSNIMAIIRGGEPHLADQLTARDVQIGHRLRRQRVLAGFSRFTMASLLDISEELEGHGRAVSVTGLTLARLVRQITDSQRLNRKRYLLDTSITKVY